MSKEPIPPPRGPKPDPPPPPPPKRSPVIAEWKRKAADRLAVAVIRAIDRGAIGTRSEIGDALLDYLDIGGMDGPKSVPEWLEQMAAAGK